MFASRCPFCRQIIHESDLSPGPEIERRIALEHMGTCPSHPYFKLVQEKQRLREALQLAKCQLKFHGHWLDGSSGQQIIDNALSTTV